MARPIPDEAPVTMAILLESRWDAEVVELVALMVNIAT